VKWRVINVRYKWMVFSFSSSPPKLPIDYRFTGLRTKSEPQNPVKHLGPGCVRSAKFLVELDVGDSLGVPLAHIRQAKRVIWKVKLLDINVNIHDIYPVIQQRSYK
jgi:hypothetical protein